MLTEEAKQKIKETRKRELFDENTKLLEQIELGRSAERLITNYDWITFRQSIEKHIAEREIEKNYLFDAIIASSLTSEKKLEAVDKIREIGLEISNFKFIISLPEKRAKIGEEAKTAFERFNKEESND